MHFVLFKSLKTFVLLLLLMEFKMKFLGVRFFISPSRYIHTGDAETYRPIAEIVEELDAIEAEAKKTDKALRDILKSIGV